MSMQAQAPMRNLIGALAKLVGEEHPSVSMARMDLADVLLKDKHYDECETLCLQVAYVLRVYGVRYLDELQLTTCIP